MRLLIFLILLFTSSIDFAKQPNLNLLKLPPGFEVSIYAEVPGARSMALGKQGTVFVGTTDKTVYAIVPNSDKTHGTKVLTIASDLNAPNGVAYYKEALFVAEINRISRYDGIETRLDHPPTAKIITTNLPKETHHGYRVIKFGPDGKLYIAIGMPCNTCLEKDPRFGTIMRMNEDGSKMEIYAQGIRNSVGFDWAPGTHVLWFTENGRDYMGDNLPPDKIDYAPVKGLNFGFPYYNGKNLPAKEYGKYPFTNYTPPTFALPAHVAPLGMTFYTGKMFPKKYAQQIFFAEHGSWNRSKKVGYQVMLANIANNKILSVSPFMTGWLQGQEAWGRPVDVLVMPDGALLVSDDYAGVIYRIGRQQTERS